jgi:hypothetical protein
MSCKVIISRPGHRTSTSPPLPTDNSNRRYRHEPSEFVAGRQRHLPSPTARRSAVEPRLPPRDGSPIQTTVPCITRSHMTSVPCPNGELRLRLLQVNHPSSSITPSSPQRQNPGKSPITPSSYTTFCPCIPLFLLTADYLCANNCRSSSCVPYVADDCGRHRRK